MALDAELDVELLERLDDKELLLAEPPEVLAPPPPPPPHAESSSVMLKIATDRDKHRMVVD